MIKRIISFCLTVLLSLSCLGCTSVDTDGEKTTVSDFSTDDTTDKIEQTDCDYIVRTDWMTFCFSKQDFRESDVECITSEAVSVMKDVRNYLNVNYTLSEAEDSICYFDSTYLNECGENRSWCFAEEKMIYCVTLEDFLHEYVHLISYNSQDVVYHPTELFSEGLAQYVSLNFHNGIGICDYNFFKEKAVSENSDTAEHEMICELLKRNGLAYNAKNYNKAFVALLSKNYGISSVDNNSEFYKYYIGYVLVDYLVNVSGGLERFMSVYTDSVRATDVFGKTIDELIVEACEYNRKTFYG